MVRKKNGNIEKKTHVDSRDVGIVHEGLQALPSSKALQERISFRALLKEKNNGCLLSN